MVLDRALCSMRCAHMFSDQCCALTRPSQVTASGSVVAEIQCLRRAPHWFTVSSPRGTISLDARLGLWNLLVLSILFLVLSHGLLCRLRCWQLVGLRRIFRSPGAGVVCHVEIGLDLRARTGQISIECASRRKRLVYAATPSEITTPRVVCAHAQVDGRRPHSRSETMWETHGKNEWWSWKSQYPPDQLAKRVQRVEETIR